MLIPLELPAEASPGDAAIHKNILGSGTSGSGTTLIISNEKIKDIIETVKSVKDSVLMTKGITILLKMKQKQRRGFLPFLSILVNILAANLWGNISTDNRVVATRQGQDCVARVGIDGVIWASDGVCRAGGIFN